jgi:osomolarity two-component system sensor histidine kinase SLN1
MDASGTVAKEQEIEFNALEGSLSMMSKGLILTSSPMFY